MANIPTPGTYPFEMPSPDPADAVETAGLPPEGQYQVIDSKWCLWDYGGNSKDDEGNPIVSFALHWKLKGLDNVERDQYFSAGSAEMFQPCDTLGQVLAESNFYKCVKEGGQKGLNKSTNVIALFERLQELNYPNRPIQADSNQFIGLTAHFNHVPQQRRQGLNNQTEDSGGRQMLSIAQVIAWPGQAVPAAGAGPLPPPTTGTPAAAPVTPAAPATAPVVPATPIVAATPAPVTPTPAASTPAVPVTPAQPAPPEGLQYQNEILNLLATVAKEAQGQPFSIDQVASIAYRDIPTDPNLQAICAQLFTPEAAVAMAQAGYNKAADGNITVVT